MKLPKNFGGKGFGAMMEQAQAAMSRAEHLEEELKRERLPVDRGPVKAMFDGRGEMIALKIDKAVVDPEDIESLEDLIVGVVREGFAQATALRDERVQQIMPHIPGL